MFLGRGKDRVFIPSDRLSKKENFLHVFELRVFGIAYAFLEREKEVCNLRRS
jgi:hypothetical protein